jgi:CheY-like chemotaxis protein
LIDKEKTNYYLEQALVAMMLAGQSCAVAPADDYVTKPVFPEAETCQAVMHHYVANSKRWYFQHNWRKVADNRRDR